MRAPPRAGKLLRLAEAHHRGGRLLQADAAYRELLELQPNHPHALHMLGVIALQYGDAAGAAGELARAAALAPHNAEIEANLGYALLRTGRLPEAADHLRAAIALQPGHALASSNLGNVLLQLGREEEAVAAYRAATAADPTSALSHYNLGLALRGQGQLEQARASLETAVALQPNLAEGHNLLGALEQEVGLLERAEECLRAALRARPGYAEAHFNLHAVRLDLAGSQAAIACLQRAVELQPSEPRYRFFLGMLLEHTGDAQAARTHLEAAAHGNAEDRARLEGWQYLQTTGRPPRVVGSTVRAFDAGLQAARDTGLVLEFGVRAGVSIRQLARLAGQEVHGFDSFEGLPEAWHAEPKGAYSTRGVPPRVPANVQLHAGWFEDSLPRFLAAHPGPLRFANIDCDLYSSTRTVLQHLASRVAPGTVLAFDEYLGYEHWRKDEFKAFQEAVGERGWRYEYICCSFFTKQAVVRIL